MIVHGSATNSYCAQPLYNYNNNFEECWVEDDIDVDQDSEMYSPKKHMHLAGFAVSRAQ
jgi:hypothetical protein